MPCEARACDPATALRAMGGAAAILATAPDSGAMSALVEGLAPNGRLLVLGIDPQPLRVPPLSLISRRACVMGSPSGHPREAEEAFRFCIEHAIAPEVETFPLRDAEAAWAELQAGTVRGRAVLLPPGRPDPERAV
jgi:D-arabinose 1-dehydrogenase-like Zn-dependent alcohol dehydrogenase